MTVFASSPVSSVVRVAIFVRVSSERQDYQRQVDELAQVAARNDWQVVQTIAYKESAHNKENEMRDGVQQLEALAGAGKIHKVLVWTASRIGRNNFQNHRVLNYLNQLGISIYVHYYRMETLLPNGKKNPMAHLLFLFFGEMAENENEERRANILSGQKRAKAQGVIFGRPKGKVKENAQLLKEYAKVVKDLRSDISVRKCAKIHAISKDTVLKVKRIAGL